MKREDDDLEAALESLAQGTEIVERLRNDPVIFMVLKSFKRTRVFQVAVEQLSAEIEELDSMSDFGAFAMDGVDGITEAAEKREVVRRSRSRLIAINRSLRDVHFRAMRIYRMCVVNLRQNEALSGLTVKHTDDLVSVVLREITATLDDVKRLFDDTKEALTNLDDKSRSIDSWFHLHKEYVFLTYNRGPHAREPEEEPSSPRKLGSRRG